MTNSFLKSLPSHKKKRKLRHQRRTGSQGQSQSEGGHGATFQPQAEAEGSGVGNISRWEQSTLFADVKPPYRQEDVERQDVKSSSHEEKNDDGQSQSDSSLLSSASSVVPATEFQYAPIALAARAEADDGTGADKSLLSSPRLSQQDQEATLVAAGASERQKEYDEETIGMYSPLSGRSQKMDCVQKKSIRLKPESPKKFDDGNGKMSIVGKLSREQNDSFIERKSDNSTEQPRTVHQQRSKVANKDSSFSREPNDLNLLTHSESKPDNSTVDQQITLNMQKIPCIGGNNKTPDEWVLTSSDVSACIDEIKTLSGRAEDDDDLIDVDLDSFQSTLEKFKAYITALGESTSSEAVELKGLHLTEWAFAIFERGMDVTHCNVCFIHEMIEHIGAAFEEYKSEGGEGGREHVTTKLHYLAECMELVFGIGSDEEAIVFTESFDSLVRISLTEDGATELLFQRRSETAKQAEPETSVRPDQQTLSPFFNKFSKILEQYSKQTSQPLQSQLNLVLKVLSKTREGAVKLQQTAIDLQDQLQNAKLEVEEAHIKQSQLEAQLNRQKYDFERHAESFDRVKEHYKHLVERKEKELIEMKRSFEQRSHPQLTNILSTENVPSHQQNTAKDNFKRNQSDEDEDYNRKLKFPKIGHTTDKEVGRAKKKNRVTMDPQVSTEEKDVINEYPPASPPQKHEGYSDSRRVAAEHQQRRHLPSHIDTNIIGQPQKRHHDLNNSHFNRQDGGTDRNPLCSLAVNSFVDHSTGGNAGDDNYQKAPTQKESQLKVEDASSASRYKCVAATSKLSPRLPCSSRADKPAVAAASSKLSSKIPYSTKPKHPHVKNPYLKKPSSSDNSGSDQFDFKYQEVVRGKDARAALPAHECEACRKFNDAIYAQTGADIPGREQMVKECSRHRARFAPELTPADFWDMDFIDER